MSTKQSNFPNVTIEKSLPENFASESVGYISSLRELASNGKPKTVPELKQRFDDYFLFCQQHDFRPGVETMCLALGITRQTLWSWCAGRNGVSEEWQTVCLQAKQAVNAFLEVSSLRGKLNPATSIFLLKNWAGYRDTYDFSQTQAEEVKTKSEDEYEVFYVPKQTDENHPNSLKNWMKKNNISQEESEE